MHRCTLHCTLYSASDSIGDMDPRMYSTGTGTRYHLHAYIGWHGSTYIVNSIHNATSMNGNGSHIIRLMYDTYGKFRYEREYNFKLKLFVYDNKYIYYTIPYIIKKNYIIYYEFC